jgi:hypothetical protein
MNDIRIIKLQDGSDIIGAVTELEDSSFYVITPMQVIIHTEGKYSGIILREWLPARLLELNEAIINRYQIVCFMKPNKTFIDYYLRSMNEMKNKLEALGSDVELRESPEDDVNEEFNNLIREEDEPLH